MSTGALWSRLAYVCRADESPKFVWRFCPASWQPCSASDGAGFATFDVLKTRCYHIQILWEAVILSPARPWAAAVREGLNSLLGNIVACRTLQVDSDQLSPRASMG